MMLQALRQKIPHKYYWECVLPEDDVISLENKKRRPKWIRE